jgi:hypothetical protein
MIVGVRPRIQTVSLSGEMTSAAIPNLGGARPVLPPLRKVPVSERPSLYIGVYGTTLACFGSSLEALPSDGATSTISSCVSYNGNLKDDKCLGIIISTRASSSLVPRFVRSTRQPARVRSCHPARALEVR